jgi:hypothetical protein
MKQIGSAIILYTCGRNPCGTLAILIEAFCGFCKSLQVNVWIVSQAMSSSSSSSFTVVIPFTL